MGELRPNARRASNAILMIWITMSVSVISLLSYIIQYDMLLQMRDGAFFSSDELDFNDVRVGFILFLYLIVYFISGITFIKWFRRAYYNLHQRMSNLSHSEEWAAIGWFVPILNFFRPYTIMVELFRETKKLLDFRQVRMPNDLNRDVVGWWWALWILSGILTYTTKDAGTLEDVSREITTVQNMLDSTIMEIIVAALEIPLAIITVKMIKKYAAVEPLLNEADGVGPTSVEESETDTVI